MTKKRVSKSNKSLFLVKFSIFKRYLKMKKIYQKILLTLLSVLAAAPTFAAVPAEVTSALTAASADGLTVAAAVLVIIVGIFAIKLMRRAL
jgi:hypothetical protein